MRKLKIPDTFELGGFTIKVIKDPKLMEKHKGLMGLAVYERNLILVDTSSGNDEITLMSFCHEAAHWVFHVAGRPDLRQDHDLCDLMAHLVMQILKSASYSDRGFNLSIPDEMIDTITKEETHG